MTNFKILKINEKEPVSPDSMEYTLQDLSSENSKRDLTGTMHKDVIAQKRTLNCKWGVLTIGECSFLLQLINSVEFNITYFDLLSGQVETRKFYVGDRTAPMLVTENGISHVSSLGLTFIEV